jgi:hypothetical protein
MKERGKSGNKERMKQIGKLGENESNQETRKE